MAPTKGRFLLPLFACCLAAGPMAGMNPGTERCTCSGAARTPRGAGGRSEKADTVSHGAEAGGDWGSATLPEAEPNDSATSAQAVTASGTTITGTMGSATDQDWYMVTLPSGRTLSAVLTPNASSDYDLYVYNSHGTLIGSGTNGAGAVDEVSVTNTGATALARYIQVVHHSGATGPGGTYMLKLTF